MIAGRQLNHKRGFMTLFLRGLGGQPQICFRLRLGFAVNTSMACAAVKGDTVVVVDFNY